MLLQFIWQTFRVCLFIGGFFFIFYGLASCFGPTYGMYIGSAAAGVASVLISFFMQPLLDKKKTESE